MHNASIIPVLFISASVCASAQENPHACSKSTGDLRAVEVQTIVKADQDDRTNLQITPEAVTRDKTRRMRLGEIFGAGCFQTAAGFSAAALVYQHGNAPEHFFQTFIWSKRAIELCDPSQKRMMGLGLDCYLINTGRKQLYASQATKPNEAKCWCLEPVKKSFPDAKRKSRTGTSLSEAFQWIDELNKSASCPPAVECETLLANTLVGSIPGVW